MAIMRAVLASALLAAAGARPQADEVALLQAVVSPERQGPEERLKRAMETARVKGVPRGISNVVQPMINFANSQYVSYMTMGKQFISGIVDTGSFELVVFGASCVSCGVAAHYNPALSGTFEEGTLTTSQNYGSGETYCYEGFEQVSIGPYPPKRQMFWEVVQAQMPILQQAAFEAIIGVGPAEQPLVQVWREVEYYVKELTSYYEQAMTAPQQAIDAAEDMIKIAIKLGSELPMLHTWSIPQFSICMGARNGADGIVVWNDTAPFDTPELFTRVPVIGGLQSWSANLTVPALTYPGGGGNATSLGCDGGCEALIDSGTSLLAAPYEVVNKIYDAMDLLEDPCDLDKLPDITFRLGGGEFSLPPSAYMATVEGTPKGRVKALLEKHRPRRKQGCEVLIMETSDFGEASLWILGVPWFRKYYTTFELGATVEGRRFHIAEHSTEACAPMALSSTSKGRKSMELNRVEADRLYLPHPRRGASRSSWRRRK